MEKPIANIGTVDREFVVDENGVEMEVPQPGYEPTEDSLGFDRRRDDITAGLYLDVALDVAEGVRITPGLRGDLFSFGGLLALGIDPRIAARYQVAEQLALTHDFGVVHQPPSFVVPIPGAKPSLRGGLQHSAGAELRLPRGFNASVELFHNLFFNMTDLLGVEQLADSSNQEPDAIRAKGRSLGAEFMLRGHWSRYLGGLLSYTLARSERGDRSLEGPASTDRTHVLNLALKSDLGRHWTFGTRFLFYSGTPARLAEPTTSPPRAPGFWRLDWRLQKRWPRGNRPGHWALTLEALNTTLNREVLLRDCSEGPCEDDRADPIFLPSVGVEAAY